MRKLPSAGALLALFISACQPGAQGTAPQTFAVQMDGKTDAFVGAFTAFFPNDLSVHPGDAVQFKLPKFSGEPHTVTLGTLVDKGVAKIEQLGPKATIADQENSPEMLKLPDIFPHEFSRLQGPPSPNQSALRPCFLDSGEPPLSLTGGAAACAKKDQPAFNGRQTFYNLGLFNEEGASSTIKFASDIKPGTYSLMCMVHRGGMTAKITVVDSSKPVDSPDAAAARGKQQFDQLVRSLQPAVDLAQKATANKPLAGIGLPNVFNAHVAEFAPKQISIPVGGKVSWDMFFFHAFSFNTPEDAVAVFIKTADGSFTFNPKSGPPINSPPPPIQALDFPPPNNGKPIVYNGGSWDGSGFRSTGIFGSVPPVLVTFQLTFTKAGSYPLRCLIHPDMKATINVA